MAQSAVEQLFETISSSKYLLNDTGHVGTLPPGVRASASWRYHRGLRIPSLPGTIGIIPATIKENRISASSPHSPPHPLRDGRPRHFTVVSRLFTGVARQLHELDAAVQSTVTPLLPRLCDANPGAFHGRTREVACNWDKILNRAASGSAISGLTSQGHEVWGGLCKSPFSDDSLPCCHQPGWTALRE